MYERTTWQICRWNGENLGANVVIGFSLGGLTIGLYRGAEGHELICASIGGNIGMGVSIEDVSLPGSLLGFSASSRTDGGRIYKNSLAVGGELTYQHLRECMIGVQGVELTIMGTGYAGYMVIFATLLPTLGSALGGGGLLSGLISAATCRAIAFLGVRQAGLPNVAAAGYRYVVIGGQ